MFSDTNKGHVIEGKTAFCSVADIRTAISVGSNSFGHRGEFKSNLCFLEYPLQARVEILVWFYSDLTTKKLNNSTSESTPSEKGRKRMIRQGLNEY